MEEEILIKGEDINDSGIMKKLNEITDGNSELIGDYDIVWEVRNR